MRILLVSDEPNHAGMGPAKMAFRLRAEFLQRGHECDLLFRPDLGEWPRNPRLRLALAPALAGRAARRRAAGRPYDVIDASSAEGWWLTTRLGAQARGGAALVARSHGLEHRYYQQLLIDAHAGRLRKSWLRRLWYPAVRLPQVAAALRRADRVIALNQADRSWIAARGWQPPERIEVIPHGVDPARWAQAPPAGAERGGGILFCGWWATCKGIHDLASAHRLLLRQGIAAPLTLLGVEFATEADPERPPASEEARVRSFFAAESQPLLRILARTPSEDAVFAAYGSHDLLVCPSTSEGFGMVVIEALSQRLPVVCSASVGAAELLRDGHEALIIPPRNASALAAAIARLWRDPELRRALGDAGHARARELSWQHTAERTLQCYQTAMAQRRGAGVMRPLLARAAC